MPIESSGCRVLKCLLNATLCVNYIIIYKKYIVFFFEKLYSNTVVSQLIIVINLLLLFMMNKDKIEKEVRKVFFNINRYIMEKKQCHK